MIEYSSKSDNLKPKINELLNISRIRISDCQVKRVTEIHFFKYKYVKKEKNSNLRFSIK